MIRLRRCGEYSMDEYMYRLCMISGPEAERRVD
jgi:hypothetical protein